MSVIQEWVDINPNSHGFMRTSARGKAAHLTLHNDESLCGKLLDPNNGGCYLSPADTLDMDKICGSCWKIMERQVSEAKRDEQMTIVDESAAPSEPAPTRGSRPWRVTFKYAGQDKATTNAVGSEDDAKRTATDIAKAAAQRGTTVEIKITNRDTGEEIPVEIAQWEMVNGTFHVCPDRFAALCSEEVLSQGAKRVTLSETLEDFRCGVCYTAVTGITLDGENMATQEKYDVNEEQGKLRIRDITDAAARIIALRREGNEEAAKELGEEAEGWISSLSGKGSISEKKTARDMLREALATEPASTELVADTADYKEIDGSAQAIEEAANQVREGVKLGRKMSGTAVEIAKILFYTRLKMRRKGLPDITGRSQAGRDIATDVYALAKKDVPEDDVTTQSLHKSLQNAVNYQSSQVIVDWLRGLDTLPLENVREYFPMIEPEEFAGRSHSEAVYTVYERNGVNLPRKSRLELEKERQAAKKLESGDGEVTAGDESDDGTSPEYAKEEERLGRVKKTTNTVLNRAKKLPESDKAKLRAEMTAYANWIIAEAAQI